MDNKQLTEISKDNLSRILGFFSRVDTVSSIVLATDIGMLAVLASNAPALKSFSWYTGFAGVPILFIGISLWHLYKGAFPHLEGGPLSLIYFREIAFRKEEEFTREFMNQTEEAYLKDILNQTYRNSQILTQKFDHLKWAFVFLSVSLPFWVIALFIFAAKNTDSLLSK